MAQYPSRAQMASISLIVLKRRRIIGRETLQAFWRIPCLRGCLPAFVIDCLLQSRPEIFDWPKGGNARRVGFFGNKLDPLLQEGKGVIFHVGFWANGVRGSWGLRQRGLGANGSDRQTDMQSREGSMQSDRQFPSCREQDMHKTRTSPAT